MQEMRIWSLGHKDPLEEGMATHSSILAWRIPWTEEPDGLQFRGSPRVWHDWSDLARTQCIYVNPNLLIYPTPFPLAFHICTLYVLLFILNYDLLLVFQASVSAVSNMGLEVDSISWWIYKNNYTELAHYTLRSFWHWFLDPKAETAPACLHVWILF